MCVLIDVFTQKDAGTKWATIEYIVLEVQKQEQRAIRTSKLQSEDEGAKIY
jgi:hypothetical protein